MRTFFSVRVSAGEALELKAPWHEFIYSKFTHKIMDAVEAGKRPGVSDEAVDTLGVAGYVELMQSCWSQDPQKRPPFSLVLETLGYIHSMHRKKNSSVRDIVKSLRKGGVEMTSLDSRRTNSRGGSMFGPNDSHLCDDGSDLLAVNSSSMFGANDSHLSSSYHVDDPLQSPSRSGTGGITMTYDGQGFSSEEQYSYMA